MMFAHVHDGQVTRVGPLPRTFWDGARWWDLRAEDIDPAAAGWHEIVEADRPADTDTHTHDLTYEVGPDGVPAQVWAQREWTQEEVYARAEAQTRLTDLEARVTALEAVVMAGAVPDDPADPDVPTWADLSPAGWWYPDTLLRDVDGTIYRNTSGTVLTTPPSGLPGGGHAWRGHLFVVVTPGTDPEPEPGPPATHPAWSADATYKVGDRVTHNGHIWRCLVAHGAEHQGTWAPGVAHTVWADEGPA